MTDHELLELAAKAAGYNVVWNDRWQRFQHVEPIKMFDMERFSWIPLDDDGDALRLAVKLLFEIDLVRGGIAIRHATGIKVLEAFNHDPCAATRRAIVRAAAEIERMMG